MSDFTIVKENETSGVLRYKGRKCGVYTTNGASAEVDISTATGQAAWAEEFKEDNGAISAFFGLDGSIEAPTDRGEPEPTLDPKPAPVPEPTPEPEPVDVVVEWRAELLAKAEAKGNIAAILANGDGRIYKGPATQENMDDVLGLSDVKEVLNGPTDNK